MRHWVYGMTAGVYIATSLFLTVPTQPLAASADRPAVVGVIEQDFNGFFLVVTNGDGHYDIFQKLDDGLGVAETANVVCMPRDMCFLEVAHMPPSAITAYGEAGHTIGGLRKLLTAIKDSYALMHTAGSEKRQAGIDAWHKAIGELTTCFENRDVCQ
ncbi:hypothetical protein [Microvirga sp. 2TAF3]|uniref:hypothetical protein n=1 Tax=Microvirga sp. 2TAF3 TaxID=3233014 RepID=UPI003F9842D4